LSAAPDRSVPSHSDLVRGDARYKRRCSENIREISTKVDITAQAMPSFL
jgi:hypothetical protein